MDERIAYVMKNPIRVDALAILNERVATSTEIAEEMDLPISRVTPHLKDLTDVGCIEIVKQEQRRGAYLNYYRASMRPNISTSEWLKLPEDARREISALVFQTIVAEGSAALRLGTFDSRTDRHISWRVLKLDESGWEALTDEKDRSLDAIEEIQAEAYERMSKDDAEEGFSVIAAALAFPRARAYRSAAPVIKEQRPDRKSLS